MTTKICPVCHSPIPAHAPGGLCPSCLLRDAEDPPESGRAVPSIEEVAAAFPNLEVLEKIGQGGMGVVFKARQPGLDRIVALKILLPELGRDPAFAERFAREARVLGKLNHPNIVTVFEHGERDGFFYLLMEYVDGVNLRQAMRAGRFTPEQALALVPGICDALQAAHAQGVWHRDIKPENILLDASGGVKIADFGIARIVGDPHRDFTLTRTGNALGSVAYMAPEQHEKPHDVDHRADIYSLGVVLYEMLTGELPLGRFPAPSRRAEVNARIDEIVLRTLEKERELRQQSASELKTEVGNAATAKDTAVKSAGHPEPGSKWTAVSLALLLGGVAAAGVSALIAESHRDTRSAMMVLVALGGAAAALGYIGSLRALYEMKRGRMASRHRPWLMGFVLWPTITALPYLGTLIWFSSFKMGTEPLAASGAGVLAYAVAAIAVPLLVAKALWNLLAGTPLETRTHAARIAAAVLLTASAVALARYVPYRESQFRSYYSRFIQLHGEIREDVDMPLIRSALDQALGDSRSDVRATIRGSADPANPLRHKTPAVILEATSPDRGTVHRQFEDIAARLRASLPKRIDVNSGAGGAGGGDDEAPPTIRDGYRSVRPLNFLLLMIPVAVVMLVVSSGGIASLLPGAIAVLLGASLWGSGWPRMPRDLPPQLPTDRLFPALPAAEYDFSTTRDAMESIIRAAQRNDAEGFQRGISGRLLQQSLREAVDLAESMRYWASLTYSRQIFRSGDVARVHLTSKQSKETIELPLVREHGEWKLAGPEGLTPRVGTTAVIVIAAQGVVTVDGKAISPEKLSERLVALAKRRPASVVVQAADTTPYNRVEAILDECQKAGLANVSFTSTAAAHPPTPGHAAQALLKAARERNGRLFQAGLSRAMKESLNKEGIDPTDNFGDFGLTRFVKESKVDETTAEVVVEATDGSKRRFTFQMILEDGAWKLQDIRR